MTANLGGGERGAGARCRDFAETAGRLTRLRGRALPALPCLQMPHVSRIALLRVGDFGAHRIDAVADLRDDLGEMVLRNPERLGPVLDFGGFAHVDARALTPAAPVATVH